ncbi:hypothetical protein Leryth_026685 [Lithospermum erythrorhizon]|nr:hypothetical protein Leryth_026685 [Lithospermum erythrorhizon]
MQPNSTYGSSSQDLTFSWQVLRKHQLRSRQQYVQTKLSIGLAEKFCGEIINSDKMQIHEGLDIVTNKVTKEESRGIPHHLLSVIEPNVDFNVGCIFAIFSWLIVCVIYMK